MRVTASRILAVRRHAARRIILLAGTLLAASACGNAAADAGRFHWAYAANYGNGVYSLSDGSEVLVVRVPLQLRLRDPDPPRRCQCGIRLLFPITIGVENFDLDDAFDGVLPRSAGQLSVLPGVELEFPRTERWTLRARAQLGWGLQNDLARESAWIYAAGIRSRYAWLEAPGRPALINGLLWSGYDPDGGPRRSMSRISNGVEFDIPVPRWTFREVPMHFMPHLLFDWYLDTVDASSLASGDTGEIDREWEIGLAAGRSEPFSIGRIRFDRVGFAVRESRHGRGFRVYFGSIF
jgi:hypothetical protein